MGLVPVSTFLFSGVEVMKSLTRLAALSLAVLSLASLVAAAPDAPGAPGAAKDKAALQGTWQVVKEEMRGGAAPGDVRDHRMVFSGDEFKLVEGDKVLIRGTFTLDPSKSPRVMEMKITEGAGPDPEAPAHGIYELKGGELKWCAAEPGSDDRPQKFDTKGTTHVLIQMKRAEAGK
jgi:uncharacterized protein (TIGR03067 family)